MSSSYLELPKTFTAEFSLSRMSNLILIIDDDIALLDNTAELLELANYKVLKARSGLEGLAFLQIHKPDLILCDIIMPELDGYGMLRALNNIPELSGTPFVFMTGKADKSEYRYGMDLGADDYLTKPFTGDELLNIVSVRLKKAEFLKQILHEARGSDNPPRTAGEQKNINELLNQFPRKNIARKGILFVEGETSKYVFYLLSGKVKTFKSNSMGKEYITNIYTPNQYFGYASLIDDGKYEETAEAIEDIEAIFIPRQELRKILEESPAIANIFITSLVNTLSDIKESLLEIAYSSARKRVAEALIFISDKYKEFGPLSSFPMNRNDISALSGITPESVSRNLTEFRKEGLIEIENGMLTILNLEKLKNLKN